jgi:hypothetical protein
MPKKGGRRGAVLTVPFWCAGSWPSRRQGAAAGGAAFERCGEDLGAHRFAHISAALFYDVNYISTHTHYYTHTRAGACFYKEWTDYVTLTASSRALASCLTLQLEINKSGRRSFVHTARTTWRNKRRGPPFIFRYIKHYVNVFCFFLSFRGFKFVLDLSPVIHQLGKDSEWKFLRFNFLLRS